MSWYPIETAPKDGSDVLGYVHGHTVYFTNGNSYTHEPEWCVVHWEEDCGGGWVESTGERYHGYNPVMWQPLTTPEEYQSDAD